MDPRPHTLRELLRWTELRELYDWDHTSWLAHGYAAAWSKKGGHRDLNEINPLRRKKRHGKREKNKAAIGLTVNQLYLMFGGK